MQLLNKDCSEDFLIYISKCTELLCKQTCRAQNTEKETHNLKKSGFCIQTNVLYIQMSAYLTNKISEALHPCHTNNIAN